MCCPAPSTVQQDAGIPFCYESLADGLRRIIRPSCQRWMLAKSEICPFFPSKHASVAQRIRQATQKPQVPHSKPCSCSDGLDIIDECLTLFRANCLFRNFEIKGPADRTLIYGILFISDCLNKLGSRPAQNQQEATKTLNALALENFNIPGEPGFPLNPLYAPPANRNDAGTLPPYSGGAESRFIATILESV